MYSKIDAKFWGDEKVLNLSPEARYLFLYFLSTPHRNVLGCYQLPMSYALEDTQLSADSFSKAWDELIKSGMVSYDNETRMVLIKNFLRYNSLDGPKQVTGAITKLKDLPRTKLFKQLITSLQAQDKSELDALIIAIRESQQAVADTQHDRISDTLSNTLSDTEPIAVTVTVNSNSNSNISPLPPKGEKQQSVPFEKIMNLYNQTCVSFPRILRIDGQRQKAVAARWKANSNIETFETLFKKTEASSFLKGKNDRNWRADFDWITKATNMTKVLEGRYDDKSTNKLTQEENTKREHNFDGWVFAGDDEGGRS